MRDYTNTRIRESKFKDFAKYYPEHPEVTVTQLSHIYSVCPATIRRWVKQISKEV